MGRSADYVSPSTKRRNARRFISYLKKKMSNYHSIKQLSITILPTISIDDQPVKPILSFSPSKRIDIPPVTVSRQPVATRVTAKARRRLPPEPSIPGSVTHCCVCRQPFTEQSPEFHCICGSIPCLDCLGDHTCHIWGKLHHLNTNHHSFVSPQSYLKGFS